MGGYREYEQSDPGKSVIGRYKILRVLLYLPAKVVVLLVWENHLAVNTALLW
jgi:hypothetical protein